MNQPINPIEERDEEIRRLHEELQARKRSELELYSSLSSILAFVQNDANTNKPILVGPANIIKSTITHAQASG